MQGERKIKRKEIKGWDAFLSWKIQKGENLEPRYQRGIQGRTLIPVLQEEREEEIFSIDTRMNNDPSFPEDLADHWMLSTQEQSCSQGRKFSGYA